MATDFRQLLIDSIPYDGTEIFFVKESDSPPARARRCVEAIVALGITTPEEMLNLLEDTRVDAELRKQIIVFTGWLKYKPAIQPLIQIARNKAEDVAIRRAAMVYLSSLGRSKVFMVLKNLSLNDPDPEIRSSAISAFAVAPNKRAFSLLTKIVSQDSAPEVRGKAIRAIGSVLAVSQSDKELAFELLRTKLTDSTEDTTVRAYAAEGLGFLNDKRAIDVIILNLSNAAPEIRYMCAYSLGELGNKSHLPLLEAMKTDYAVFEHWGTVADGAKEAIENITQSPIPKRVI